MASTLSEILLHHAQTIPDQIFTRIAKKGVVEKTRTFAEAWEWAAQWAALFAEKGIGRGDTILLALPNCDAFAGAYFGALIVGAIPAPVAPFRRLTPDDPYLNTLADRIRFVNAKALVVPPETAASLSSLPAGDSLKGAGGAEVMTITESHLDPHSSFDIRHSSFILHPSFHTPALLQFTSGTLGSPRPVLLTHRALIAQIEMLKHSLKLYDRFKDWAVSWLPLFHDMGLIGFLLTPMVMGGEVTLLQTEEFILRPSSWLKAITERKATITGGPPSAYALCAKRIKDGEAAQYDLSSVRIALVGAETVTRESLSAFAEKFRAAGFRSTSFMPTYGLAEAALAVTMPPLDTEPEFDMVDFAGLADGIANPVGTGLVPSPGLAPAPGDGSASSAPLSRRFATGEGTGVKATRTFASVGAPLPEIELAIVNENGERLPERQIGEIILRSPSLMSGYLHDDDAQHAIRNNWLHTGDLGYLADGKLHITGRKKEVIIVGGRNYYPDDVEQIASAVPGVRAERVVAIGVEDPERATERLVVLAETDKTDRAERDALRMQIRQTLTAAGYPMGDVILLKPKSIQSTLTGKPMRMQCRDRFLAGEFQ